MKTIISIFWRESLIWLVALGAGLSASKPLLGATATGTIMQKVVRALSIQRVSDLDFGSAAPGDGMKTVPPGTAETQENASFLVKGEVDQCYQIILPADGSIYLVHQDGDASRGRIGINAFKSYPAVSGALDATGKQMLFVGATRNAIADTLRSGTYTGVFTVAVVY